MEPVRAQLPKEGQIEPDVLAEMLDFKGEGAGIAPGRDHGKQPKMRYVTGHIERLQTDHAVTARQAHRRRVAAGGSVLTPAPAFHSKGHGGIAQDFSVPN